MTLDTKCRTLSQCHRSVHKLSLLQKGQAELRRIFKCGIKSCGQQHQHSSRMRGLYRPPQLPAQLSDGVLIQGGRGGAGGPLTKFGGRHKLGSGGSMQMNTGEINLNGGLAGGKDNQGRHEIEGEKAAKEKKKGRILLVLRTNGVTHYTAASLYDI